ncbi:MAG: heterodisulfide reductase-related iron-sulfur binding cluster [Polyangiaceae bacterium]
MKIEPKPEKPPVKSPSDPRYWDAADLEYELKRQFEVCHGCRMCVNYCGSFPDLFARVDRDIEHKKADGAERLDVDDFRAVTELCWQCKLCYIDCPYTPDQGHEWALDIPRLLGREKALRAKREGVTLQDQALGEPGVLGKLASGMTAPMANLVSANALLRKVQKKVLGISEEFPLPPFASQPFERWLDKHVPAANAGSEGTVALFASCLADFNFPDIGASAVQVLEKNGYRVTRPPQVCCGIPNLDGGDIDAARAKARTNVKSLLAAVEQGHKIVVPNPSCSYTIRKEYPELLDTADARKVAENTFDLMEFLDGLRKQKKLDKSFERGIGKVAYHAPCHLRAQKIGNPGARILGLLPDTTVEIIEKCSAVDGTWGMKAQHYEMGRKYAQKLVRAVEQAEASVVVTDCPLSSLRMAKENAREVFHPIQALAYAYGLPSGGVRLSNGDNT